MSCFPKSLERQLAGGRLTLTCRACGHVETLPFKDALARLGPDATPMAAQRRTRCASCGLFRVFFS